MNSHTVCYNSSSKRDSSRIYQDLKSVGLRGLASSHQSQLLRGPLAVEDSQQLRSKKMASKPHIGIVGAGISGLRCADILLQNGFRVTILEARNRVGGRLHQEKLPNGHTVDMGPNWIHGTDDNPILDLAKETGTIVGSWDDMSYVFSDAGELYPVEEAEKYTSIMWDIIQDAFKHSNTFFAEIKLDESLHDFFVKMVAEKIPETEVEFRKKRNIILQMSEMWGAFIGTPIETQSLKFFWLEECIEGENLFCAGTYKKISEAIAKRALEGAEIKYETKAVRMVRRENSDDKVKVQVNSGVTLEFDELVVTAPLGWLKRNLSAFVPELPTRMTQAIEAIGYGFLEKVYISFPKPFWLTPDNKGRKVQGFMQWISPDYAPETNPGKWNQEVVELAGLAPETSHPTLLFYTYGKQSKWLTSKTAELASQEEKTKFILDFFKPYYSRMPNYSDSDPDCQPTNWLATDWCRDELAGYGSYSNFQVGLEDGDNDIRTMREGLPDQGLWFAGEHTAPFVGLGTATGAYWSGEAVGQRIAEVYGQDTKTY